MMRWMSYMRLYPEHFRRGAVYLALVNLRWCGIKPVESW